MIDRLVIYLLLAGSVLFGAILYLEIGSDTAGGKPAIEMPRRANAPVAVRPQKKLRHRQLVAAILERPLFSPTRRPAPTASGSGAGADLADARLTGIVTLPPLKIAIFAVKGAKPLVLGEGESVSGWRIDRITPAEIALSGPSGARTLRPKEDPALVRARPPAVAAGNRPSPFNARPAPGAPFRPARLGPPFVPRPPTGAAPVWRP
ncbi:MAG TPA: hypothetical protein VGR91_10755 [Stellaceae bacterium]|nr:hypothetical protein [Stellaceae bacterium]